MSARIEARVPTRRPVRPWIAVGAALILSVAVTVAVVVITNGGGSTATHRPSVTTPAVTTQTAPPALVGGADGHPRYTVGIPAAASVPTAPSQLIGGPDGHPRYQPGPMAAAKAEAASTGGGEMQVPALVNDHPRWGMSAQAGTP